MSAHQPQVFISYQRSDGDFARQVREHLVAHGVRTWMDQFDIPVGAYWPDEIDKGLSSSDIVVGVLSPDAVESRNVKNEWDWALQNHKQLLLLLVKPTIVPHRYVSINFIDVSNGSLATALEGLMLTLGARVAPTAVGPLPATPPATTRHANRGDRRRRRVAPVVLGREPEQAQLRAVLDAMQTSRGGLVLLGGEAGVGKTTLTSWLAAEAEGCGALVVSGGCYDLSATPPYGPWLEIIRGWPDETGIPRPPTAVLDRHELAALQGQAALFELVRDWLLDTAGVQPLLLLLEDLHWAEQASLDFLRFLARSVSGSRLLLVATWRDDDLTRRHPLFDLLPVLAREVNATRISLPRLAPDAVRALVAERYQLAPADAQRVTDYVSGLTEGNPFFAGEVLRTLEENGALVRDGDTWHAGSLAHVHVPSLVRNVIERRLARIGDEARPLLDIAAVIGQEVPIDLWVEVSGADEAQLTATLEQAVAARMVEELPGGERFRFTHALIRETLYEGLVSLRRRGWHRKVAEMLERDARPNADVIAHHYQQAGDGRAFEWLAEAGYRAFDSYAFTDAGDRFEAAAALIDGDAERRPDHAALLVMVMLALRYTDLKRALRSGEVAMQELAAIGEFEWLTISRLLVGLQLIRIGRVRAGIDLLLANARESDEYLRAGAKRSAIELSKHVARRVASWHWMDGLRPLLPELLDRDTGGYLGLWWGSTAHTLATFGRFDEAHEIATQVARLWPVDVITALKDWGAKNYLGDTWHAIATTSWMLGRPDEARQAASTARVVYASFNHQRQLLSVHETELDIWLRYAADRRGELPAILSFLEAAFDATKGARPLGIPDDFSLRRLLWQEGNWAELRSTLDAFLALGEEAEAVERHDAASMLAQLLAAQGDAAGAWDMIRMAFPRGPQTEPGDHFFTPALRLIETATSLALDAGDFDAAGAWIAMDARWLEWSGSQIGKAELALLRSRLQQLDGDLPAAEASARQALALVNEPRQPMLLVAAQRSVAGLLMTTGEHAEASALLVDALALAEASHAPYQQALTCLALAEIWLKDRARSDTTKIADILTQARTVCERLDSRAALERVAALEKRIATVSDPTGS